jgi:hypothetical protein
MSRYVRPRRRSSSINSRYGSRRERGDFAGNVSRMSFKLSSIRAAKPRQNLLRVYSGRALDKSLTNAGQMPNGSQVARARCVPKPKA